jgi:AcrR family transcriptional regulator
MLAKRRDQSAYRRREERTQVRRKTILQIAARLFKADGYAGTTMSSVASELGGLKSTLWSIFPSKMALYAAVIDEGTAAFREKLERSLIVRSSFPETVHAFCRLFVEGVASVEGRGLYRLAFAEAERFPEVGQIFVDRGPALVEDMLTEYFSSQGALGHLAAVDARVAAKTLMTLCTGEIHRRALSGLTPISAADVHYVAALAAEIFFRAFAPARQA